MKRRAFISKLRRRFSLRLHMTMILMATAMSGVIASKLMLAGGITNPAIRYPLTVLFAYGVFFIAIKFWLWIIFGVTVAQKGGWDLPVPDYTGSGLPGGSGGTIPDARFSGGGGKFSGGGSSGSYGNPVASSGSDGSSSGGSSSGGLPDLDLDEGVGIIIVIVVLVLLLIAVFGVGAYMVYQAPAILSEIAFDSVLAVSLVRKSKKMQDQGWMGSVFRATWKQFAFILVFAMIAGAVIHAIYPDVTRLSDIYHIVARSIRY